MCNSILKELDLLAVIICKGSSYIHSSHKIEMIKKLKKAYVIKNEYDLCLSQLIESFYPNCEETFYPHKNSKLSSIREQYVIFTLVYELLLITWLRQHPSCLRHVLQGSKRTFQGMYGLYIFRMIERSLKYNFLESSYEQKKSRRPFCGEGRT